MKILFLCVANAARSQMAEALARQMFGEAVEVMSAGSKPCGYVHPWANQAMAEVGIDISGHRSKSLAEIPAEFLADLDFLITLCADEVCPPGLQARVQIAWPLVDPAADQEESKPDAFRLTRDKLEAKLKEFARVLRAGEPLAVAAG